MDVPQLQQIYESTKTRRIDWKHLYEDNPHLPLLVSAFGAVISITLSLITCYCVVRKRRDVVDAPASVVVHNTVDLPEPAVQTSSIREEIIPLVEIPSAPPPPIVVMAPRADAEAPPPLYPTSSFLWPSAPIGRAQGPAERAQDLEKGGLDF